jgi:hypothetical protein
LFLFAAGLASRSLYPYLRNAVDGARVAGPTLAMPNPQCVEGIITIETLFSLSWPGRDLTAETTNSSISHWIKAQDWGMTT